MGNSGWRSPHGINRNISSNYGLWRQRSCVGPRAHLCVRTEELCGPQGSPVHTWPGARSAAAKAKGGEACSGRWGGHREAVLKVETLSSYHVGGCLDPECWWVAAAAVPDWVWFSGLSSLISDSLPVQKNWLKMPSFLCPLQVKVSTNYVLLLSLQKSHTRSLRTNLWMLTHVFPIRKASSVVQVGCHLDWVRLCHRRQPLSGWVLPGQVEEISELSTQLSLSLILNPTCVLARRL